VYPSFFEHKGIWFARGDNGSKVLIPPLGCWARDADMWDRYGTYGEDGFGLSYHSFFINFLGFVTVTSFLLLVLSSLYLILRN